MNAEPEDAEMCAKRLELERVTADIGRAVAQCFPPGVGFLMVAFDFGGKGHMAYVANGHRSDIVTMLGELRDKLRAQ